MRRSQPVPAGSSRFQAVPGGSRRSEAVLGGPRRCTLVGAEKCTEANVLCGVVGPKELQIRTDIKLEDRLKNDGKALNSEYYTIGQNVTLKNVSEVPDYLMLRDFPELYNYTGKNRLGSIFVPDSYIPASPHMVYADKDNLPKGKTKSDFDRAIGDMAERSTYEVLKALFTHKKFKGSVLVLQGLNMLQIDPEKRRRKHNRELDFFDHS